MIPQTIKDQNESILFKRLQLVKEIESKGYFTREWAQQAAVELVKAYQPSAPPQEIDAREEPPLDATVRPSAAGLRYRNFDLRLSLRAERRLYVEVATSPDGSTGTGEVDLPPYGAMRIEPGGLTRSLRRPEPAVEAGHPIEAVANSIGSALLPEEVRRCFDRNLALAGRGEGLRIRLRIEDDLVAAIPWELAYVSGEPLAMRQKTLLVRHIVREEAPTPLRIEGPLNVLTISSSPNGLPELNVAEEQEQLEDALGRLVTTKPIHIEPLPHGDPTLLREYLRKYQPHIIHFVGHGSYDQSRRAGALLFKDPTTSQTLSRPAEWLARLLRDSSVRFVFLNACNTAHAAGGLAYDLVRRGVPAVLGMQTAVLDRVAIAFASGFYKALADLYPVDVALVEARIAIYDYLVDDLDRPDWAQPVLYMNASDGMLFE